MIDIPKRTAAIIEEAATRVMSREVFQLLRLSQADLLRQLSA